MNRPMATVTAMPLIFRLWVREGGHRVRGGVGNAGDGVTSHGMAWLSTNGDQSRGVLHPRLVHFCTHRSSDGSNEYGGGIAAATDAFLFSKVCVCNLHVKLAKMCFRMCFRKILHGIHA